MSFHLTSLTTKDEVNLKNAYFTVIIFMWSHKFHHYH